MTQRRDYKRDHAHACQIDTPGDDILGSHNSSLVKTNTNGELFLKFCLEKRLNIINSIFRTKRIHRGTWVHKPTGLVKRLDYITTRKFISRLVTSCRAYRNTASIFDFTDHYMVMMRLRYPTTHTLCLNELVL